MNTNTKTAVEQLLYSTQNEKNGFHQNLRGEFLVLLKTKPNSELSRDLRAGSHTRDLNKNRIDPLFAYQGDDHEQTNVTLTNGRT